MNYGIDGGEAFGSGAVLALFSHGQTHTRNDLMCIPLRNAFEGSFRRSLLSGPCLALALCDIGIFFRLSPTSSTWRKDRQAVTGICLKMYLACQNFLLTFVL